jgi:hypothetical protein
MISKQAMRRIAWAAVAFASGQAAAITPDPTGLWYDARDQGWGLNVAQQGDTVFATLFVYDPAGNPAWYVASEMRAEVAPGGGLPATRPIVSGALFPTDGPSLGGPFDPHPVLARSAGAITLKYTDTAHQSIDVGYLADGTTVTKTMRAQPASDDSALLPGRYAGGVVITTAPTPACPRLEVTPAGDAAMVIDVSASTATGMSQLAWGTGLETVCTIGGRYEPRGAIAGTLGCGSPGAALSSGTTAEVAEITPGPHGFAARVRFQHAACTYAGHIGGVRLP